MKAFNVVRLVIKSYIYLNYNLSLEFEFSGMLYFNGKLLDLVYQMIVIQISIIIQSLGNSLS